MPWKIGCRSNPSSVHSVNLSCATSAGFVQCGRWLVSGRDETGGDAVAQVKSFAAAGGQVLFGTDVGYMSDYEPAEEYRLMARALEPMQILASLTTSPAARWKESEKRGRIDEGLAADLVVLDADPAEDAANFAKVRCTIRAGKLIYGSGAGGG